MPAMSTAMPPKRQGRILRNPRLTHRAAYLHLQLGDPIRRVGWGRGLGGGAIKAIPGSTTVGGEDVRLATVLPQRGQISRPYLESGKLRPLGLFVSVLNSSHVTVLRAMSERRLGLRACPEYG